VKQFVNADGAIQLSLEVIEFLARVYKNNIRELEKGFNNVSAYCSIFGEEPTVEVVKKAINYQDDKKKITPDVVIAEVAKFYGLKSEDLKGSSRTGNIRDARKVAVYIIRELMGNSWQSIGDSLGGRKYTTMMVLHKGVEDEKRINSKLCDEINTLFNIINQL
ncbi:MAG: helix-turn-helix domain-containing protein, partial [bacterium]|nr:helix-turn-helix domain-containing protein [bacterium]